MQHTPGGWPLSITGRSGDTVVCGCSRGVGSLSYHVGLDCRRLGRFGDTIRWVGMELHRWDAAAIPCSVGWIASCTRMQVNAARDALRYHAVGVLITDRAGLPTSSAIPSVFVSVRDGRLGRYGDTMMCGKSMSYTRV